MKLLWLHRDLLQRGLSLGIARCWAGDTFQTYRHIGFGFPKGCRWGLFMNWQGRQFLLLGKIAVWQDVRPFDPWIPETGE